METVSMSTTFHRRGDMTSDDPRLSSVANDYDDMTEGLTCAEFYVLDADGFP
jgi:hypothetical protein